MKKFKFLPLLLIALIVIIFAGCDTSPSADASEFYGDKGEALTPVDGYLYISESDVDDGKVHYYNVEAGGKIVYFFVIKSSDGKYRAAANACQVCFGSNLGFRQEGDYMVCNTCGNQYPMSKIATEKGGCNPGPINSDLKIENGQVVIDIQDVEAKDVVDLFI